MGAVRIIIVEEIVSSYETVEELQTLGFESVKSFSNPNLLPYFLKSEEIDIVLLDTDFYKNTGGEEGGLYWLKLIMDVLPGNDIVVLVDNEKDGDAYMEKGASEYVIKPVNVRRLASTLKTVMRLSEMRSRCRAIENENRNLKNMITNKNNSTSSQKSRGKAKSPKTLEEMERTMIEKTLIKQRGNHSAASEQLGITRQTLYNKIRKYGLSNVLIEKE
jgi:DNA-binding NtrC family response regulator